MAAQVLFSIPAICRENTGGVIEGLSTDGKAGSYEFSFEVREK